MTDRRDETSAPGVTLRSPRTRAWLALLVACLAVLAWPALEGVRLTRSLSGGSWHDDAAAADEWFGCLARRVDDLVPPQGRVFVDPGMGFELYQRLTEAVVRRPAEPVDRPELAETRLTVAANGAGACGDATVVATAPSTGATSAGGN